MTETVKDPLAKRIEALIKLAPHRTVEAAREHLEKATAWKAANFEQAAQAVTAYATTRSRGVQPRARVVLNHGGFDRWGETAAIVLGVVAQGAAEDIGTTNLCYRVGQAVCRSTGYAVESLEGDDETPKDFLISVGFVLIQLVGKATGAYAMVEKDTDAPQKVGKASGSDGEILKMKFSRGLELYVEKGSFLTEALQFAALETPTCVVGDVAEWTDQQTGGDGRPFARLVHLKAAPKVDGKTVRVMAGCTAETAPRLFQAANILQNVKFRVHPVAAELLQTYDEVKARAFFEARMRSDGTYEKERATIAERMRARFTREGLGGADLDKAVEEKSTVAADRRITGMVKEKARL